MEKYLKQIENDIANLSSKTQFELNKLPSWGFIPDSSKTSVGRAFRKKVRESLIEVGHIGLTTDRHDLYEKL